MAGREARATDAAALTAVTIGRAVSDTPAKGTAKTPTKGPAGSTDAASKAPVTLNVATTTGQGTNVKQATFAKAGPVVNTKAATTVGVKTTTNVAHPDNKPPVVGNKGFSG
jgi:hypothetical protein